MLRPEKLAEELRFLLEHSPASPGLPIEVDIIANPAAGGFTRPKFASRRAAELATLRALCSALPPREGPFAVRLHLTDRAGHASEISRGLIAEARAQGYPAALRVLMTAGGDGTSLEAITTLMELPDEERRRWLVLRLPLGTGNDGSEGRELGTALGRFLGPCSAALRPAILATPNPAGGKKPIWSFNIASVGADAFIADLTNKLKASFPGDSYKFWVDVASVTYDFAFPSRPLRLRATGPKEELTIEEGCLFLAFGASGRRQYGSNKKILPGPENVCFVSSMGLFRKLTLKSLVYTGDHASYPGVRLFEAERVLVEYGAPLLFQADGEVTRLEPNDFPLEFRVVRNAYSVLEGAAL